jgi:hypothetical protein
MTMIACVIKNSTAGCLMPNAKYFLVQLIVLAESCQGKPSEMRISVLNKTLVIDGVRMDYFITV